jgi:uncharacterized phage-associated protein
MEKFISIRNFAQYLTEIFGQAGDTLTNKKLQKILYYVQAWHLVYFNSQLFDETPEAWVHGPVYPSVYQQYKKFKFKQIEINENCTKQKTNELFSTFNFSVDKKEFLEEVLKFYGGKSALELELATHREKPWIEARRGLEDYDVASNPIKLDTMKEYYTALRDKKINSVS